MLKLGLSPAFVFRRKRLTVGLIVVLIQMFLYSQADWIYGALAGDVRQIFHIYFFLLAIALSAYAVKIPTVEQQPERFFNFIITFVGTSLILITIPALWTVGASIEMLKLALGFGFLHAFVKAYIEEVVFRFILPKVAGLGDIISSVIFGLFHVAVSGASMPIMAFLMALGFIFSLIRRAFGLMGATGAHFAWNMAALGLLPKVFGA